MKRFMTTWLIVGGLAIWPALLISGCQEQEEYPSTPAGQREKQQQQQQPSQQEQQQQQAPSEQQPQPGDTTP